LGVLRDVFGVEVGAGAVIGLSNDIVDRLFTVVRNGVLDIDGVSTTDADGRLERITMLETALSAIMFASKYIKRSHCSLLSHDESLNNLANKNTALTNSPCAEVHHKHD
jgi:hypothetical protein